METFIVGNDTFLGKYVIAIGNREIINENVLSRVYAHSSAVREFNAPIWKVARNDVTSKLGTRSERRPSITTTK